VLTGEQLAFHALDFPVGDLPGVNANPAKKLSHFVSPKEMPPKRAFTV
jgi:hypothetical protein